MFRSFILIRSMIALVIGCEVFGFILIFNGHAGSFWGVTKIIGGMTLVSLPILFVILDRKYPSP
jgi:hypothetical protein